MRPMNLLVLTALLAATTAGVQTQTPAGAGRPAAKPSPAAPASAVKGNVANGKVLYTKYGCYQCHGRAGQGGPGPKLGPNPLPLEGFTLYSRQPAGEMPPYTSKIVTDQELADIHAFVSSLPPPSPGAKAMLSGGK